MTGQRRTGRYQALLVGLLSLNFGIVFFDRNALNFLMPFVQPELQLNNTQIGMLASALSLTWALAAFGIGKLSDTLGNRKRLLILATLAFSLCSVLSGIASSFAFLLGARLLMGVAEGGIMPISHAMIASEVTPERRGLAQGIAQNLGSSLLGSFVAPVLLVAFAAAFGWRSAFYLAAIPGLVSALLIWWLIDEPAPPPRPGLAHEGGSYGALQALKNRNILICVILGVLLVSYLVICWAFMPIYLTQVRGYAPDTMGWLMGTLGVSAAVASFVIAGLSDRIGRRPVMIVMPFVAVILPLAAIYYSGPTWMMAVLFFIGWSMNGIFPMFMATVPTESVDPHHAATALGLTMGVAEVLGGVFSPFLAGMAADATDLSAPLWIMLGLTVLSGLVAMGLKETAPSQVSKKASIAAEKAAGEEA